MNASSVSMENRTQLHSDATDSRLDYYPQARQLAACLKYASEEGCPIAQEFKGQGVM